MTISVPLINVWNARLRAKDIEALKMAISYGIQGD